MASGKGIVEGQVVLHAAGDDLLGLVGQRLRAGALVLEVAQELLHPVAPDGAHRLVDERLQPAIDLVGVVPFGNGVLLAGYVCHRFSSVAALHLLLVLAQLGKGDLAHGQRDLGHLPFGAQRQQVGQGALFQDFHVVDGPLHVVAKAQRAVVLHDVGVVVVLDALGDVLLQEPCPRRRVGDDLHRAAQKARLLVEQRRDGRVDQRQRAGIHLVGVDDGVHVRPGLIDRGVQAALDRGRALAVQPVQV